jgi:uncharacterized membrane protein
MNQDVRRGRLLRGALAALFVASGAIHLIRPSLYLSIMPPYLPYPLALILVSGVAEIAGGAGLLFKPTRRVARDGLIALLVAVFPANIQMAVNRFASGASPLILALLLARLPLQPLLIWLVSRSDRRPQWTRASADVAPGARRSRMVERKPA